MTQAVVDGHHDNVPLGGELRAVVFVVFIGGPRHEPATVDPEQHRMRALHRRRHNVEEQTVLARPSDRLAQESGACRLHAAVREPGGVAHARPWPGRDGRQEPAFCNRGLRVADTAECQHAGIPQPLYPPEPGVDGDRLPGDGGRVLSSHRPHALATGPGGQPAVVSARAASLDGIIGDLTGFRLSTAIGRSVSARRRHPPPVKRSQSPRASAPRSRSMRESASRTRVSRRSAV